MTLDLARLPKGDLPALYRQAQLALQECSNVDECQSWADKARALASYAKQADDDTLMRTAVRIQARAIKRAGELLRQIEPQNGAGTRFGGTPPSTVTRSQAARDAGMSDDQRKTALRVASIPEDMFDRLVDGNAPLTVTALAAIGTKSRPLVDIGDIPPEHYSAATELQGMLRRLAEFCREHDAACIGAAFQSHEVGKVREQVLSIDPWLDLLCLSLP